MVSLFRIQQHINAVEEQNNKSYVFVLNSDFSGAIEESWAAEPYQQFENLAELNTIVSNNNLKPILIDEV